MDYEQWNEILITSLFSSIKEDKIVLLSLSKEEIVSIGKKYLENTTDIDIWNSFKEAIRSGISGASFRDTLFEKALTVYLKCWKDGRGYRDWHSNESKFRKYPPYFLYLISFTLPLTEYNDSNSLRSYYDRCNSFYRNEGLPEIANCYFNSTYNWNELWYDFEEWANIENSGKYGKVYLRNNSSWVYVEKALSQTILTNHNFHKLFYVFSSNNLIPHYSYDDKLFQNLAKSNKILFRNAIQVESEESICFVSHFIRQAYLQWNGEAVLEKERKQDQYTRARLFLSLKISHEDDVSFGYRIYSKLPIPDDLFSDQNLGRIQMDHNGYSNILRIPFKRKIALTDSMYGWKVESVDSIINIFINGAFEQLSAEWWIETNKVFSNAEMLLLCENKYCKEIETWGKENTEYLKPLDVTGLPDGYTLYRLSNPSKPLDIFPIWYDDQDGDVIQIINGLRIEGRKYLNVVIPKIRCLSKNKIEKVSIKYDDDSTENLIETEIKGIWVFPKTFKKESRFHFMINGNNYNTTILNYEFKNGQILSVENKIYYDKYNSEVDGNSGVYVSSNTVYGLNDSSFKGPFIHLYSPQIKSKYFIVQKRNKYRSEIYENDYLLYLLSTKGIFKKSYFYDNLDIIVNILKEKNSCNIPPDLDLNKSSAYLLKAYNYLGYISSSEKDYYRINRPEFLNIPSLLGREIVFIGARDKYILDSLLNYAYRNNIACDVKREGFNRIKSDRIIVLPSRIRFYVYDEDKKSEAGKIFSKFAREFNISYDESYLPSWAFYEVLPTLKEYENFTLTTKSDNTDHHWCRKVFVPDTLRFIHDKSENIDKEYSLVEYELNYRKEYKLWINGNGYFVDKNWGRFLAVNKAKKNIVVVDSKKNKVAIPVCMQLPIYAAKSIYLMSNDEHYEDVVKYGNNCNYYSQIFSDQDLIIIKNLFHLKLGQEIMEGNLP